MKFKVFRFKKVKSTNNTAIRIIRNSKLERGMIISELQSDGRGQYGRRWISEKGNLFVSLFYVQNNLYLTLKQLTKINSFLVKKINTYNPDYIIFHCIHAEMNSVEDLETQYQNLQFLHIHSNLSVYMFEYYTIHSKIVKTYHYLSNLLLSNFYLFSAFLK